MYFIDFICNLNDVLRSIAEPNQTIRSVNINLNKVFAPHLLY